MFRDWRWGEHVAGTRERFLFPLLGCCPADMADVEGGCWRAQMMTNVAAGSFVHPTDTLSFEAAQATWSRQLVQTLELLLALELQQLWGTLPRETQGPTDHTAVICNGNSIISSCGLCREQWPAILWQQVLNSLFTLLKRKLWSFS